MENFYSPQNASQTFFKTFAEENKRSPVKYDLKAPPSISKTRMEKIEEFLKSRRQQVRIYLKFLVIANIIWNSFQKPIYLEIFSKLKGNIKAIKAINLSFCFR